MRNLEGAEGVEARGKNEGLHTWALSLSLNLSSNLNVPLESVGVSKCGSELGEIKAQFVEGKVRSCT